MADAEGRVGKLERNGNPRVLFCEIAKELKGAEFRFLFVRRPNLLREETGQKIMNNDRLVA